MVEVKTLDWKQFIEKLDDFNWSLSYKKIQSQFFFLFNFKF